MSAYLQTSSSHDSMDEVLSTHSHHSHHSTHSNASYNSFHYQQRRAAFPDLESAIDLRHDGPRSRRSSVASRHSAIRDPFFRDDLGLQPRPNRFNVKDNLTAVFPLSFLCIPTLEFICFVILSDIIWKYIGLDNMKREHADILFTVLDFFSNCLGALSALGIWICTRVILNCDLYKTRNDTHVTPSAEWWINGAVFAVLGFLSSTFLAYEISDALIHTIQEYDHALKLIHFASLCIQKLAELSIVLRSVEISISMWWNKIPSLALRPSRSNKTILEDPSPTLSSVEKRKLIACIIYCAYAFSILLVKTILTANLNPIRFKELLDIMHHSASNLTLSLVRPGYQMLYFKLFICFLYVLLRWVTRTLFCNYSWDNEDNPTLIKPRQQLNVKRNESPKNGLFGIILCGGIVALHWVQISGNSPASIGAARIVETVVYVIMFLWSAAHLFQDQCSDGCRRNVCNHPTTHISIHTFSLLLVTSLALVAQGASSLIYVFVPHPDWIAFSSSIATIPFITTQCMVVLVTHPKGVYRIVLLAVDVAFCYYALASEAHHIEDLLDESSHHGGDWSLVFVISIFWSVLEYYVLVLEHIILTLAEEIYTVVSD